MDKNDTRSRYTSDVTGALLMSNNFFQSSSFLFDWTLNAPRSVALTTNFFQFYLFRLNIQFVLTFNGRHSASRCQHSAYSHVVQNEKCETKSENKQMKWMQIWNEKCENEAFSSNFFCTNNKFILFFNFISFWCVSERFIFRFIFHFVNYQLNREKWENAEIVERTRNAHT